MLFNYNKLDSIKITLSVLVILFFTNTIRAADPVLLNIPELGDVEVGEVSIPLIVSNFNEIFSFTVSINYDSDVLVFKNISGSKVPSLLSGGSNGQVRLGFFGTSPVNLGTDTLLYLNFTYNGNFSNLEFGSNNEVTDLLGNRYELVQTNGSIGTEIFPTNEWVNFFSSNSTIDSNPIQIGDEVRAYDQQGNLAGKFTVVSEGSYGPMKVYRDDPSTTNIDEGLDQGEEVVFKINGLNATPNGPGSAIWSSHDDSIQLDLVVISNQKPVIETIPNQEINEGGTFTDINLDDYVSDIDNSDSELVWTYSGNTELVLQINGNRVLSVTTPDENWNGSETITLEVKDPGNLSDSKAVTFTVLPVNDNPVITSNPVTSSLEDQLYSYQVTATDAENNTLTYSLNKKPAFLSISPSGLVSGTPTNSDVGVHEVEVGVSDGNGGSAIQNYNLTIQNVNDKPVIETIPNQEINEGGIFTDINLDDYVSDIDNSDSELVWTYSGNTELVVQINGNRVLSVTTPDENWNGSETITLEVKDPGNLSDSKAVTFTVLSVNDNPVITSTPITSGLEDQLYSYQVTATDAENNTLTYALNKKPDFLSISPSGLVSGTPTNSDVGVHEVEVGVSDGNGGSAIQNYNLTIEQKPFLDTPILLLPVNNNLSTALTDLIFDWQDVNEALTYELQVSVLSDFGDIFYSQINLSASTFQIPNGILQENTKYYWKVRASDGTRISEWSSVFNFTTEIIPLNPPNPLLPSNNATNVSLTPEFDWSDVQDAVSYSFQISFLSDFSDIFNVDDIVSSNYLLTNANLVENTEYFWRVKAFTSAKESDWSEVSSFTTGIIPLDSPSLLLPENNAENINLLPSFDWNDVLNATNYQLELSFVNDFSSLIIRQENITTSNYTLTIQLDENTQYFWRVRALNSGKISEWSQVFNFKTELIPLILPALLSPSDGSTDLDPNSVELDWSDVTDASSYDIQVSGTSDFGNFVVYNSTSSNFTLGIEQIDYDSQYFWRVKAKNAVKESDFTAAWGFSTMLAPLDAPGLIAPADGAANVSLTLTLDWGNVTEATKYGLQIATDEAFTNLAISTDNLDESTYSIPDGILSSETMYYWRVNALDGTRTSEWSEIRDFTTVPATGLEIFASGIPDDFALLQNYPNPFNPSTNIRFALPEAAEVKIQVVDLLGREVDVLFKGFRSAGFFELNWDASRISSGTYIYRIDAKSETGKEFSQMKKMMFVK